MKKGFIFRYYTGMQTQKFGLHKKEHIADVKFDKNTMALKRLNLKINHSDLIWKK